MKTEKKTITIDKLVIPALEEGRVLTVDDINGAVAVVTEKKTKRVCLPLVFPLVSRSSALSYLCPGV